MAKKKDRGWVKLYRKIQDSAIWTLNDPMTRRCAWIDLILMANHEDRTIVINGRPIVIHPGQHWTSYQALSMRWGWSRNKVLRFFRTLKELGMATTKGTKSGTLVSLTHYGFYQYGWNTNGPTDETSNGTSDGTTDGTTDGTQTRTKEALKKNVKEERTSGGFSNRKELISADGDDYQ